MNFLQLVNRARQECGISGGELASITGSLPLESKRFKDWVATAWEELQAANEDWLLLRGTFSFDTTPGVSTYAPTAAPVSLADFSNWKRDSLRAYTAGQNFSDEQLLHFLDYPQFRNLYEYSNMRFTQARPTTFSIGPGKSLVFGPVPNVAYTIVGEYYKRPQVLADNADEPTGLPQQFHMLIVYEAMKSYAMFESAPEVFSRAETKAGYLKSLLEIDRMPDVTNGPPLA